MSVGEMSVGEMSVGEVSVGEMSVGEMSWIPDFMDVIMGDIPLFPILTLPIQYLT